MMQILTGMVVRSTAGRDANRFYIVLSSDGAKALIADGKVHKLVKPKVKNLRHLAATGMVVEVADLNTDKKIRRVLWPYNYGEEIPVTE